MTVSTNTLKICNTDNDTVSTNTWKKCDMNRQGHSIYKHMERVSDKKTVGQTDRQKDRMLDRQMVEQTGRMLDRGTNTQTSCRTQG